MCVSWKCIILLLNINQFFFLYIRIANRINLRYLVICKNVRQRPRKTVDGNGALIDASCVSQAGISKVFMYYFFFLCIQYTRAYKIHPKKYWFLYMHLRICRCNSAHRCSINKNMGATIFIYIYIYENGNGNHCHACSQKSDYLDFFFH